MKIVQKFNKSFFFPLLHYGSFLTKLFEEMLQENKKNKLSKRKIWIYEIVDLTLDSNNRKS